MTAPRWIAEAIDAAYDNGPGDGRLATALLERLPIEAMARALAEKAGNRADQLATIVGVLTDGDPEVVTLTELYQGASRALDEAGVPYASDPPGKPAIFNLADRIKWLAMELAHAKTDSGNWRGMYDVAVTERSAARRDRGHIFDDLHSAKVEIAALTADRDQIAAGAVAAVERLQERTESFAGEQLKILQLTRERDDMHRVALKLRETLEEVRGRLFDVGLLHYHERARRMMMETEHITKDPPAARRPLTREQAVAVASRHQMNLQRAIALEPLPGATVAMWVVDAIIEASR